MLAYECFGVKEFQGLGVKIEVSGGPAPPPAACFSPCDESP